jgi:hypothetical protein
VGSESHHLAREWAHMVPPLSCLVVFLVDFFFSWSLFFEKMTWQKDWVRLTSEWFLKVRNKEISFIVLKPNERGLFKKTPKSMANKFRSS